MMSSHLDEDAVAVDVMKMLVCTTTALEAFGRKRVKIPSDSSTSSDLDVSTSFFGKHSQGS